MLDFSRLKTLDDVDVAGRRVIVRADLNVPVRDGRVTDKTRLARVAPCLLDLAARGAKVIVISHFGRPKAAPDAEYSLRPVAEAMTGILMQPVAFADDCVGPSADAAVASLPAGRIAVLENLRFHPGEEKNDPDFAAALARNGDMFVSEAFSTAHRAHASTEAITRLLPSYAGPLMMEEISALRDVLEQPTRPTAAVVGGAKVSTKIPILENLVAKVDKLIIGGGMANTFLAAQGLEVGRSLQEPDFAGTARDIMRAAESAGCTILLPTDAVVASEFKVGARARVVPVTAVPQDQMILDVGPGTVAALTHELATCNTLLWNGPLGAFEIEPFGKGTFALARVAAALTEAGALVSVAGGGDTVAALNAAGVTSGFTYVSTAGGAFLEWLEGRVLPGVVALAR
ncbi:MAG: phosphoglycerate kinase [Hyphomicrobiaceae bacterium]|nr:phosphoglycerate kinase [Hyphomicrobiaceae bacterium]